MRDRATINPEMFILARESRGLTQNELKDKMGVIQGTISKVEQGILRPSEDLIGKFSEHLSYPKSFFYQQGHRYPPAAPFHRKRQSLSRSLQSQIEAIANIRNLHISKLLDQVDLTSSILTLQPEEYKHGPVEIAHAVRHFWRLPRGPINDLTAVMEHAGMIVIFADFGTHLIDGITFITTIQHPVVYINKDIPTDRMRLTLAHELGHIVMHDIPRENMEEEAFLFAGEFLAPGDEIGPYLHNLSLDMLARLKPYWKMAMSALIMRAKHLKKITADEERRLWAKMNYYGYMQHEPIQLDLPPEKPSLMDEVVEYHQKDLGYSNDELCKLLAIHDEDLRRWYIPKRVERLRVVK